MSGQFDLFEGRRLRDEGMQRAADKRPEILRYAKSVAKQIAQHDPDRLCDIDQVQSELFKVGMDLGMAAGSVFKGGDWIMVGTRKTKRKTSHARDIKVWRLK